MIIMDYTMQTMSGLEVAQQIRTFLSDLGVERQNQPYIALLSSFELEKKDMERIESQVDICLTKPIFKNQMK